MLVDAGDGAGRRRRGWFRGRGRGGEARVGGVGGLLLLLERAEDLRLSWGVFGDLWVRGRRCSLRWAFRGFRLGSSFGGFGSGGGLLGASGDIDLDRFSDDLLWSPSLLGNLCRHVGR